MDDLALTLVFAIALVFLELLITSAMVAAHTDVRLPRALRFGDDDRKPGRRALLLEIPLFIVVVGGGVAILVLFVVHPHSTIQVRFVAAAALIASAIWFAYLGRKIAGRG